MFLTFDLRVIWLCPLLLLWCNGTDWRIINPSTNQLTAGSPGSDSGTPEICVRASNCYRLRVTKKRQERLCNSFTSIIFDYMGMTSPCFNITCKTYRRDFSCINWLLVSTSNTTLEGSSTNFSTSDALCKQLCSGTHPKT